VARSWTIVTQGGTSSTRSLPDTLTPFVWQGFIAVTNPRDGSAPREIHAPGSDANSIVLVRLTTAPYPGTPYTYTLTPWSGSPISFTLPDAEGIDQFSMEGKGAVSITAPIVGVQGVREPVLVARADIVRSLTVSPLE
jgi:hypothetical protein